jgi:hypothetical protein
MIDYCKQFEAWYSSYFELYADDFQKKVLLEKSVQDISGEDLQDVEGLEAWYGVSLESHRSAFTQDGKIRHIPLHEANFKDVTDLYEILSKDPVFATLFESVLNRIELNDSSHEAHRRDARAMYYHTLGGIIQENDRVMFDSFTQPKSPVLGSSVESVVLNFPVSSIAESGTRQSAAPAFSDKNRELWAIFVSGVVAAACFAANDYSSKEVWNLMRGELACYHIPPSTEERRICLDAIHQKQRIVYPIIDYSESISYVCSGVALGLLAQRTIRYANKLAEKFYDR